MKFVITASNYLFAGELIKELNMYKLNELSQQLRTIVFGNYDCQLPINYEQALDKLVSFSAHDINGVSFAERVSQLPFISALTVEQKVSVLLFLHSYYVLNPTLSYSVVVTDNMVKGTMESVKYEFITNMRVNRFDVDSLYDTAVTYLQENGMITLGKRVVTTIDKQENFEVLTTIIYNPQLVDLLKDWVVTDKYVAEDFRLGYTPKVQLLHGLNRYLDQKIDTDDMVKQLGTRYSSIFEAMQRDVVLDIIDMQSFTKKANYYLPSYLGEDKAEVLSKDNANNDLLVDCERVYSDFKYNVDLRGRGYYSYQLTGVNGEDVIHREFVTPQDWGTNNVCLHLVDGGEELTSEAKDYVANELYDCLADGNALTFADRLSVVQDVFDFNELVDGSLYTTVDYYLSNVDCLCKVREKKLPQALRLIELLITKQYDKLVVGIDCTASHLQINSVLTKNYETGMMCNIVNLPEIVKVDTLLSKLANQSVTSITDKVKFTKVKYVVMTAVYGKTNSDLYKGAFNKYFNTSDVSKLQLMEATRLIGDRTALNFNNNQVFAKTLVLKGINYLSNKYQFDRQEWMLDTNLVPSFNDYLDHFSVQLNTYKAYTYTKPIYFTYNVMGVDRVIPCYAECDRKYSKYYRFGEVEGIRAMASAITHAYDSSIMMETLLLLQSQHLLQYKDRLGKLDNDFTGVSNGEDYISVADYEYILTNEDAIKALTPSQRNVMIVNLEAIPEQSVTVLPNHDCFMVHPNNATKVLKAFKAVLCGLVASNSLYNALKSIKVHSVNLRTNNVTVQGLDTTMMMCKLSYCLNKSSQDKYKLLTEKFFNLTLESDYCLC